MFYGKSMVAEATRLQKIVNEYDRQHPPRIILKGWKRFWPPARKQHKLAQELIDHAWKNGLQKQVRDAIFKEILK